MEIEIRQVIVPIGSTIGFVVGVPTNDATKVVVAAGDQSVLSVIVEAMAEAEGPLVADVPDWAVLRVYELPE